MSPSFYWHDYETWGADPSRDWPCQFAGLRTDPELCEIGAPLVLYCRPPTDRLPDPDACLVTGITPQHAEREGVIEAEFADRIASELSQPGTCGAGYNSLRFDDEVTRYLLYRNLRDPYAREWRDGNSRWDLIDTIRLAQALRPEGLAWPRREDGTPSFRLGDLTAANGISHDSAHDALSDVRATVALARRLRQAQPRLFDYALSLRDKTRVRELLERGQPLLHVSARYPARLGCIAPVLPIAPCPERTNEVICCDLRADPEALLGSSVEALRSALFAPTGSHPPDAERPPLKTIHLNRAPILAPMKTLTTAAAACWAIDPALVAERARQFDRYAAALRDHVRAVYRRPSWPPRSDPDRMLYGGGFVSDRDRRALEALIRQTPAELAHARPVFKDAPHLQALFFRYRARNWPDTLTPAERDEWDAHRFAMLTDPAAGASLTHDAFEERLARLKEYHAEDSVKQTLLVELSAWGEKIV